ncbi:MAG: site-specific integrase [Thermoguttaceae bacterium]
MDLTGRRPVFRIYAAAQKARRDELLPMTPDFAQGLLETFPEPRRHGRVFRLMTTRDYLPFVTRKVGQVVSRIGEKAGVVVNKTESKYGSAHDLRRAFGTRWAKRPMPAVLQRLMRHSDISTTMKFYVSATAADAADDLWAKFPGSVDNLPGAAASVRPSFDPWGQIGGDGR